MSDWDSRRPDAHPASPLCTIVDAPADDVLKPEGEAAGDRALAGAAADRLRVPDSVREEYRKKLALIYTYLCTRANRPDSVSWTSTT